MAGASALPSAGQSQQAPGFAKSKTAREAVKGPSMAATVAAGWRVLRAYQICLFIPVPRLFMSILRGEVSLRVLAFDWS